MNMRVLFAGIAMMALSGIGEVIPMRAVAHRGLWDDKVAENTVEAIRRAYAAGAECVETDFHEEKNGDMMCYHDLGRVGWVKARYPDYRMPTLEEVLAVVPKDREIQAEIKTYGPGYAEKFVKAVRAAGLSATNVTVSSFDYAALKDFKARHPEFPALWLVDLKRKKVSCGQLIADAKAAKLDVICPGCVSTFGTFSPKDADAIRSAGMDFRVYGVNTPSQFRRAVQLGASGFTSDRYLETRVWAAAKMPRRGFCAHRGDRAACPENTPVAIKTAIEKGAEMVEFDLQRCKTGEIVVMHDFTVNRTTDGKGRVMEMTFDELRKLDAGVKAGEQFRGTRVPTLDEMLAVIPKEGVWINFHCYYADNRCIAEEVAEKLTKEGRLHQGILAANEAHIAEARAKVRDVITCDMSRPGGYAPGWTPERIQAYSDTAISNRCDSLQYFYSGTAADFEYARRNGLTVNYFESDDPERSAKLFADGVDFILTNDIDAQRNVTYMTRKFVAAEQRSGQVVIYSDYPGREPVAQWLWAAKGDPNVREEDRKLFGVPDECKPVDGGKFILMNDSCGGFAGLDVMTGLCAFYGNAGGNPHSVDRLPDGRIAVASSTGRTLKIFDVKEHPFEPAKQKVVTALDLPGGHGVVWDAKRNSLFALGYTNLYELAYASETMSVTVKKRWDYVADCGDAWGHDLLADGQGGYYFTNHSGVWRFDPATEKFALARDVRNVKSFSPSKDGDLLTIPRESWWTDTLLVLPSGSSDLRKARKIVLPGARFYKARWF